MLCTTVAQNVVDLLKLKKPGNSIKAETDIPVMYCLDPEALFGSAQETTQNLIGIFAFNTSFKIEGRGSNKRITAKTFTIVVAIAANFPPQKEGVYDAVAPAEAKPYQDLQQLINECLAENAISGVTLVDVIPEPPQDLMLGQRYFLAGSEITYVWTCT